MTIRLAQICRHPIKAYGREMLASVRLSEGAGLPFDREWAVAHEAAKLVPGWNPCMNFTRGANAPELMAVTARLDEDTRRVTLAHPTQGEITVAPDDPADHPRLLAWTDPLIPAARARPAAVVAAGRAMTDSDFPSVSVLSLASLAELGTRMGLDLSIHRWRGNLWLEGAAPWTEWDWVGKRFRLGGAVLEVVERITRCTATTVDPETGKVAGDTLAALEAGYGHRDLGVFARVIQGGEIATGQEWRPA
ncbi:MAG: molybdenum cofactor biosysynthesis protein [Rhodobacter sp.]|nr:molybdenum cofactor biosysynthesis protein [Rhodobacter sp.]